MKQYILPSELNISGKPIPEDVADKMLVYHIAPMNLVRHKLEVPVTASLKSGYRSIEWELANGRDGKSEHTFKGLGAVDWTCKGFEADGMQLNDIGERFLKLIIEHTGYTRITLYNFFIHCDYARPKSGKRGLYISGADSIWEFVGEID